MFEQTFLTTGEKRPWTFLVSVSGQMLLAAVFVSLPLIYTETIGMRTAPAPPMVFRPMPEPPPIERTTAPAQTTTSSTSVIRRIADVFRAPTRIPTNIPNLVDEPGPNITSAAHNPSFESSAVGVPGSLINGTAPPPPVKREPVVEKATVSRTPVPVGGDVQAAKLIRKVVPEYPPLARQARVSGTVRLKGIVGKDGAIQQLELVSGHPLLAPAALQAVRQWIYRPTLLNGQPVEVMAPIDVIFTLGH